MEILIDETIKINNQIYREIKELFNEFKISIELFYCKTNPNTLDINFLSKWVEHRFKNKIILLSSKKIIGQKESKYNVHYIGCSDKIGGNLAIIRFNVNNLQQTLMICLHEAFHLFGLNHCKESGCIMGFKLCRREFKYCVMCKDPCITPHMCEICKKKVT